MKLDDAMNRYLRLMFIDLVICQQPVTSAAKNFNEILAEAQRMADECYRRILIDRLAVLMRARIAKMEADASRWETLPERPLEHTMKDDARYHYYIQPGGCLEFGQVDTVADYLDLVHFCPGMIPAVEEAIAAWKTRNSTE